MKMYLKFTLLLLTLVACSNTTIPPVFDFIEESCDSHFPGVRESQLVHSNAFEINIPLNWKYKIEESNDGNTTYVFTEIIDTTITLKLTDQEFQEYYNNFETISLTYGEVYPDMDYGKSYQFARNSIMKDSLQTVTKKGLGSYENNKVNWITYTDRNFEKDGFICESFTTCILNNKYYLWIILQTCGDKNIEERSCTAKAILETIKLRV